MNYLPFSFFTLNFVSPEKNKTSDLFIKKTFIAPLLNQFHIIYEGSYQNNKNSQCYRNNFS